MDDDRRFKFGPSVALAFFGLWIIIYILQSMIIMQVFLPPRNYIKFLQKNVSSVSERLLGHNNGFYDVLHFGY